MPVSSVINEQRRLGWNKLSRLEPSSPVVRYEHQAPGDVVHIDIKKLGRIDGVGQRVTGDRSQCKRGSGWECLHMYVDDHCRLAYAELLPDEKATTAACFLIRAANRFTWHGVQIRHVMIDNGSAYVSRLFRAGIAFLEVRHVRTRPCTPRSNGRTERFIQTGIKQWGYRRAYGSWAEREGYLLPWLHDYNHRRPHTALHHKLPVSRLAICAQPLWPTAARRHSTNGYRRPIAFGSHQVAWLSVRCAWVSSLTILVYCSTLIAVHDQVAARKEKGL